MSRGCTRELGRGHAGSHVVRDAGGARCHRDGVQRRRAPTFDRAPVGTFAQRVPDPANRRHRSRNVPSRTRSWSVSTSSSARQSSRSGRTPLRVARVYYTSPTDAVADFVREGRGIKDGASAIATTVNNWGHVTTPVLPHHVADGFESSRSPTGPSPSGSGMSTPADPSPIRALPKRKGSTSAESARTTSRPKKHAPRRGVLAPRGTHRQVEPRQVVGGR